MDKRKTKILTKKIIIRGMVQGVGFRPFVYRLAKKHGILGTVQNMGGLVEVKAQADPNRMQSFLKDLNCENCENSEIVRIQIEDTEEEQYSDFKIIKSSDLDEVSIVPIDLSICSKCEEELFQKENRRAFHPFISCMSCGPRYTIIENLPYDRENTTMKDFSMCPFCEEEYEDPFHRRFHAETVSCHDCGPTLIYQNSSCYKENLEAFTETVNQIKSGEIVAIKGIGGFHYCCSPFIKETVRNLRKLKGREEKPFAVMFDSLSSVREYCILNKEEEELLTSKEKPIVLLYKTQKSMVYETVRESLYCGAFLPYTALQFLLLKECGPLIMTSANLTDQPIIKEDEKMLSINSPYLKGVLLNKRRILRSVDDSVIKLIGKNPQMIRRSRGYVPYPIWFKESKKKKILALGGDLKAAFCLCDGNSAVLSQYFGDLENEEVYEEFKNSIEDLSNLFKFSPDMVVCDLHPSYYSSKFANSLSVPIHSVQHHHAHIASVLAEHQLTKKVLGVAFDGTGYGTDGNIWGGEFFICHGAEFERIAHLEYTPMIGGDSSMKDGKKTATCFLLHSNLEKYIEDERKEILKSAIRNKVNTHLSSSMGRLFDAVSSLLNICHENRYEGECAALLEKEAYSALQNKLTPASIHFEITTKNDLIQININSLLKSICTLREKMDKSAIALGFHIAVGDLILIIAKLIREKEQIHLIALSGGVFQNKILTEYTIDLLKKEQFQVYMNSAVPPNDGGISLGQAYIQLMR